MNSCLEDFFDCDHSIYLLDLIVIDIFNNLLA